MYKLFFILTSFVFSTSFVYALDQPAESKTDTKLEAFQAKTGIVIINGYTTVGVIKGMGSISIDARDIKDASNLKLKTTGISFTIREAGRLERENTAFVDSDEIDSLITGIDYISKTTKGITSQAQFEIQYKTKGNFRITVFNNTNGELSAVVSAGNIGRTSAYISIQQLSELKSFILEAKAKL